MAAAPAAGGAPKSSPLKPASAPLKPASTAVAPASVPLKAGAAKAPVAAKDGGADGDADEAAVKNGAAAPKSAPLSPAVSKPSKASAVTDADPDESDSEVGSVSGLDKILAFAALLVAALALVSTFLTYSVLKA